MKKVSLILCAYHEAGCRVLNHIARRDDIADLAVFTHEAPDGTPDVRAVAKRLAVPCFTKDISRGELPFRPDIISSVYYRNIISPDVIQQCGDRIFNAHPSLLPRHRGCSAVPWAIIDGDTNTGITYHMIDEGIDTGNIVLQSSIEILPADTQADLYKHCIDRVVDFWPAAFELVKLGFQGVEQQGRGSIHRRGAPNGGEIDPSWSAEKIERFIRAMTYPPFPYASYEGSEVRSWEEYQQIRAA